MNVVMFTPALKTSAIGRMANLVVRALVELGHHVVVVRAERESLLAQPAHGFGVELVPWTDHGRVKQLAAQAEMLVYQIGDNYDFHLGCMEWLPRAPGIVCLHDFFLGHLFWAWAQNHVAQADASLRAWYGTAAAASYFCHPSSDAFIAATCDTAPMTEWIGAMALGVITHSNWGVERLRNACPGAVYVVPLPYDAPVLPGIRDKGDPPNFRVLTVGHINPNKRVPSVIAAIGNSPELCDHAVYRLVGSIHCSSVLGLSSQARNHQVKLVISDRLDDAALATAIDQADVIACLRWPSLEAASASAIEAMLYGKPLIVTDVNFYSEIPDDCVIKIDPADEVPALQRALEMLYRDDARRAALGRRGQQWARATFRADRYALRLEAMAGSASRSKPALDAIDGFARTLCRWGGSGKLLCDEHTRDPLRLFAAGAA
jgi:glycosyltransferase involved in cell wall biosynthesis